MNDTKEQNRPDTVNTHLDAWVKEMAALTKPDQIYWVDGSEAERERLTQLAVDQDILIPLNPEKRPNSYLHRSDPRDVARVEHLTFICSRNEKDAGPTNNWMAPDQAYAKLGKLFDGSMKGRTLFVIPYSMGPVGSPMSKIGVEITDSPYVAASMRIMTRMGQAALDRLGSSDNYVKGLHS
ncbi:MAG: phosphoenolpyruvate carboxykinase, partial [bacterium]